MAEVQEKTLVLSSRDDAEIIKALSSDVRLKILDVLSAEPCNVNDIAGRLDLPQSTVATNVAILEKTGLIDTENTKARKGSQKICAARYREILVRFGETALEDQANAGVQVEMPIGLYTNYEVSAPCGLCSPESVIGYLDVPDSFLNPDRMKAGLLWFEQGWVEYKFPNNSIYKDKPVRRLELSLELSSETPGTNPNWLSDISIWINNVRIGVWTSPGDFGDRRGKLTPAWWKLEGSQYGLLKNWLVTAEGSFVDGVRLSDVTLGDLKLADHHSIKVRIGVEENAEHLGGINIFGKTFGNYSQDIVLRLMFD